MAITIQPIKDNRNGQTPDNGAQMVDKINSNFKNVSEGIGEVDGDAVHLGDQSSQVNYETPKTSADMAIQAVKDDKGNVIRDTYSTNMATGIDEFPEFSDKGVYNAGDIVRKDGRIYEFKQAHSSKPWIGTDARETSLREEVKDDLIYKGKQIYGLETEAFSTIKTELGSISISFEDVELTSRLRSSGYIRPPFNITIKEGYVLKRVIRYTQGVDGTITPVDYAETTYMEWKVPADAKYIYRLVFARYVDGEVVADYVFSEGENVVESFEKPRLDVVDIDHVNDGWMPNTFYPVGVHVDYSGDHYACLVEHTSGDSFDDQYWGDSITYRNIAEAIDDIQIHYGDTQRDINGNVVVIDRFVNNTTNINIGEIVYLLTCNRVGKRVRAGGLAVGFVYMPPKDGIIYIYNNSFYQWDKNQLVRINGEYDIISTDQQDIFRQGSAVLASGMLSSTAGLAKYNVLNPIELNEGDRIIVSGFVSKDVAVISETNEDMSGFNVRLIGTGEHYHQYEYVAMKHEFMAVSIYDNAEFWMYIERKKDYVFTPKLEWDHKAVIFKGGYMIHRNYEYRLSNPIYLLKGDTIVFDGHTNKGYATICKSFKYVTAFMGQSYPILYQSDETTDNNHVEYTLNESGWILFGGIPAKTSIVIRRRSDSAQENCAAGLVRDIMYGNMRHNYVDEYDFVPNVAHKRVNSILNYNGDTKAEGNYMVNAVAYPNGDIIACRAGGKVVKISNGVETELLYIPNSQDWRGVFMDSNLNVYVSPHSSTFSDQVSGFDRGLYRLAYKSDSFVKVISLLHNDVIIIGLWAANTPYSIGDVVFNDKDAVFYVCKSSNSDSSFTLENWEIPSDWAADTSYAVGSLVRYKNNTYVCHNGHISEARFDVSKWHPATSCMVNDDTVWTMCEDDKGHLYAGVYAHSVRKNPAVYKSFDGGVSWIYQYNFSTGGAFSNEEPIVGQARHVHCINFNEYDHCLYAAVGEINTVVRSEDHGVAWHDMEIPCYYGQPTYVLGVKDGIVIGSDGHYSCGVSKILTDNKTIKLCGRLCPGFIFNIRRSDMTGWLYAFTRIDNCIADITRCPPAEAVNDSSALEAWKTNDADVDWLGDWTEYNVWASKYYPEDAIRPLHAAIMVSKDEGDTWEVIRYETVCDNNASICGYITVGYFRDGEILVGSLKSISGTNNDKAFVNPIIISEGKKKRTSLGYDLEGEIYIQTNENSIVSY